MTAKYKITVTPLHRTDELTVNQWAYLSLRKALMIGQIPPESALTIRGLATALHVSPTPVREALRRLVSEGALESLDNRRVRVPSMTAERFKELCDVRILIETHAARCSVPYIIDADIDRLRVLDERVNVAYENANIEAASLANQEFHRYLYTRNPHQISQQIVESLWLQLGPFFRVVTDKLRLHYTVDRHTEAIEAAKKRDSVALCLAIEADIRSGVATLHSFEGLSLLQAKK